MLPLLRPAKIATNQRFCPGSRQFNSRDLSHEVDYFELKNGERIEGHALFCPNRRDDRNDSDLDRRMVLCVEGGAD